MKDINYSGSETDFGGGGWALALFQMTTLSEIADLHPTGMTLKHSMCTKGIGPAERQPGGSGWGLGMSPWAAGA